MLQSLCTKDGEEKTCTAYQIIYVGNVESEKNTKVAVLPAHRKTLHMSSTLISLPLPCLSVQWSTTVVQDWVGCLKHSSFLCSNSIIRSLILLKSCGQTCCQEEKQAAMAVIGGSGLETLDSSDFQLYSSDLWPGHGGGRQGSRPPLCLQMYIPHMQTGRLPKVVLM